MAFTRHTPQVRIFHGDTELSQSIERFYYKYSEKEDDQCILEFFSDDPELPDHPFLQEGAELIVIFGYVETNDFKRRKVYIWDIKPQFTERGLKLTVTAYDKFASAKQTTSKKVRKKVDIQSAWLELANKYKLQAVNSEDLENGELRGKPKLDDALS